MFRRIGYALRASLATLVTRAIGARRAIRAKSAIAHSFRRGYLYGFDKHAYL